MLRDFLSATVTLAVLMTTGFASAQEATARIKREAFDRDPGWEGHNNHVVPKTALIVKQDFGYSPTRFVNDQPGEIGGRLQRSATPASYGVNLAPLTLADRLTASGTFAVTACQPGASLFFGFFQSEQPGGSGRPIGSLGLDFDFEGSGGRLAVRLITGTNKSCGTFITPYLPGKFRPTPLKRDGTRYRWTLDYDPAAARGRGQFVFTLHSDTHTQQDDGPLNEAAQQEARARFPNTTRFVVDLPPGHQAENATFDRFGLMNMMKAGGAATIYFDDLTFNGQPVDLAQDPNWMGAGNRTTFEEQMQVGAHNFGFRATNHAGGQSGEVGGDLWRSGDFGYYADRVGPLGLGQKLEARGKVKLATAGPDSDIFLGWFSSASRERKAGEKADFVGVHVGGPTRVGHYFIPVYATAKGSTGKVEAGPILVPGRSLDWSLVYDPAANQDRGEITVTLGNESVTLPLKPGQKAEGVHLDRFGLFTSTIGGQLVRIFLDDVSYTVR